MIYQRVFTKIVLCSLIAAVFAFSAGTPALAGSIKERMKQRLPEIIQLKATGIVGENNQGFLAFVNGNKGPLTIVTNENRDRKTVYAQIAKQQNTTAELVGKRRARQLFGLAKSGEFVQKANGTWVKKQ